MPFADVFDLLAYLAAVFMGIFVIFVSPIVVSNAVTAYRRRRIRSWCRRRQR